MTTREASQTFGHTAPILQGVWRRITTFGALRGWSHCWAAACLFVGLLLLTWGGWRWLPLPAVGWLLGHGVLVALTSWNARWDEMMGAQWRHKYASRYDAG